MRSFRVVAGQSGFPSQFDNLRHDARGGAFLSPHQQLGALALPTTPTNGQTITLVVNGNSIPLTAVTGTPTNPGDVKAPGTAAGFAANVLALLNQPQTTTANGVALSAIEQQLLSYLSFSLVGTTITFSSANNSIFAPLSSLTVSTTVTGASWTAQTMQLYVEPGVVYVNGTRIIFTGGSTPTVTAPSTNPRIDVLTIDSTGTLAWTTGTEASSPTAPAYPADKVALCELYNVVGETALYDIENQQSGQGYVYNDVRPILGLQFNPTAISDSLLPDADGTRNLGSLSFEWNNIYVKSGIFVNGLAPAISKFGGTGTDGALSFSSGTTTIACGSAAVVEKNYTSISITGTTAKLAFSGSNATLGTTVILRSQGAVTITSSNSPAIDITGMGGGPGNAGTIYDGNATPTAGAGGSSTGAAGTNTAGGGASFLSVAGPILPPLSGFSRQVSPGGNGGGSGANGGAPGTGGRGGGGLYIECAGAYNFTGTINGAGANGSTGSGGGTGGGGGGGNILVLYASLTADSGTYTVTAGTSAGIGTSFRALNTYFA